MLKTSGTNTADIERYEEWQGFKYETAFSKVHPKQIMEVKDRGNAAWVKGDLKQALILYSEGLKLAEQYGNDTQGTLPQKSEFGEIEKLRNGQMFD